MQKYFNQRKVLFKKKTTNVFQDPTVNLEAMAYPGHPLESPLGITLSSVIFRLPI